MNSVKMLAVFAENRLGQMAQVTKVLAEAGVNIRCLTIATTEVFGVIKMLVDKCDVGYHALRQHGFTVSMIEVLAIEVEDKPGGLHTLAEALTQSGINLENSSAFVSNKRAVLIVEVKDPLKARRSLEKLSFKLLTQEEILTL